MTKRISALHKLCNPHISSFLLLAAFLVFGLNSKAVDFKDCAYGIAEFDNKQAIVNLLSDDNQFSHLGLSIQLEQSIDLENFSVQLENEQWDFSDFLTVLKAHLQKNTDNVFPLFIEYKGAETELVKVLETAQLLDKVFYQAAGERWSSVETILAENKQLVIFTQSTKNTQSQSLLPTSQHIIDFTITNSGDSKTKQVSNSGSIQNELLLIRKFTKASLSENDIPKDWSKISLNNYSIDYLLECWNITGKRPNFIFYSEPMYTMTCHFLSKTIRDFDAVSGQVSANGHLLNGINWKHNNKSYTGGYFSFPYTRETTLTPLRKGYTIKPEEIEIDRTNLKNIEFTAIQLKISEGLRASYQFNNELANLVNPKQKHLQTNTFVNDTERGTVLKLEDGDFAMLRNVEDYGIVDNSFTISVFFKISKSEKDYNYCIFGSNEAGYRKGLHTVIKSGTPLFGFYTNDCIATEQITTNKWHQLTVRYEMNAQTQSIFVDGKKVGHSANHPSFIGSTELLLGHGIKHDNFMNGYLDELNIWDRALSNAEIKWLYSNNITVPQQKWIASNSKLIIALFILVLAALGFILVRISQKRKRDAAPKFTEVVEPLQNAIRLYGKFTVLDGEGKDHSATFSPKTRELFLLLLLHSIKNPRGISTTELTKIIWSGFSSEKAANNRGVTFNHLKKILAEINGVEAVYENKYWRLILSNKIHCDYQFVHNFLAEKRSDYAELYTVIKRGEFLSGAKKEWLLDIQSTHNFDLIDKLLAYSKILFKQKEYETTLEIANYILMLDDLNVQALHFRLRCLSKQGSGNKAAFIFDKFCQKYQAAHSKSFEYELKEFLKMDVSDLWE